MEGIPSHFRFGLRTLLEFVAVLAVVLAFFYQYSSRRSRFEIVVATDESKVSSINGKVSESQAEIQSRVFLLDSESGRVWHRSGAGKWKEETPTGMGK